jgi:hypothetical protein
VPKYDLAVVGAGLGGLAAAALAARQGKKTIVLEPGDSIGGALGVSEMSGFVFYPGPALSFGFERGATLQKLSESLGISLHASVPSPCYQVALPDRRISIFAEQGETLEELRREFPSEIDGIARFYRDLRTKAVKITKSRFSAYLSRWKTAGGFIRKYRFSGAFMTFLDVQSYYFFHQRVTDISLVSLITLCDTAPFMVHGGFKKIGEQMVDVLLKNRGEIRYNAPLSDIDFRKGRAAGFSTPQGLLEAETVLLKTENTEEQRRTQTLFIGIRDEVVPIGMLQNVLCVADYSHAERFFALSLSDKDDEAAAPRGMRALTASFSSRSPQHTKEELLQQVSNVIPFLNDFMVLGEEYKPASRAYILPEGISFKTIRTPDSKALLSRSSMRGVYMLYEGSGTPAQEIAAAQTVVERLK